MAGLRGLKESHATERGRNNWKRPQMLFYSLTTIHMSNLYLLSWSGMIHSVANFGWSVGATATASAG